jgi:hypothetical protein
VPDVAPGLRARVTSSPVSRERIKSPRPRRPKPAARNRSSAGIRAAGTMRFPLARKLAARTRARQNVPIASRTGIKAWIRRGLSTQSMSRISSLAKRHWRRERKCKPTLSRPKSTDNTQNRSINQCLFEFSSGNRTQQLLGADWIAPASGFRSRRTAPRLIHLKVARRFGSATTVAIPTRATEYCAAAK